MNYFLSVTTSKEASLLPMKCPECGSEMEKLAFMHEVISVLERTLMEKLDTGFVKEQLHWFYRCKCGREEKVKT